MKLFFSVFLVTLLLAVAAQSQITINSSDIPLKLDVPLNFKALTSASLLQIKNNTNPGPNQTWDFSGITVDNTLVPSTDYSLPANPPYPDASYWYPDQYYLFGYNVPSKEYEKKDATGIYTLGFSLDSLYLDLNAASTGAFVILPKQNDNYNPPYQRFKFPISYNYPTVDTIRTKRQINGRLTVPAFGLSNIAVGYQVSYLRTTSQTGWGTLKLPGYKTNQDVLLVIIKEMMTDSIFLNGSPAPTSLLTLAGLQQGHSYYNLNAVFYGKGYPAFLLKATQFFDNDQPQDASGYMYVNPDTTGVNDPVTNSINASAYPNPVNDNLNIRFNKTNDAAWTLNFYNSTGTMVKSFNMNNSTGEVTINVNFGSETPNGIYFYNIIDNGMSSRYTGKIALVR
jgi:hypothetical protein